MKKIDHEFDFIAFLKELKGFQELDNQFALTEFN